MIIKLCDSAIGRAQFMVLEIPKQWKGEWVLAGLFFVFRFKLQSSLKFEYQVKNAVTIYYMIVWLHLSQSGPDNSPTGSQLRIDREI